VWKEEFTLRVRASKGIIGARVEVSKTDGYKEIKGVVWGMWTFKRQESIGMEDRRQDTLNKGKMFPEIFWLQCGPD
jgi:hypothetical protein